MVVRVGHLDSLVNSGSVSVTDRAATTHVGEVVEASEGRLNSHGSSTALEIRRSAPEAEIYSIAVIPDGEVIARIVRGLEWVLERDVHIVCLALGIPAENAVLDLLIDRLVAEGALVVAAVGNGGAGHACQPAVHPAVLAIGACDDDGRVRKDSSSSFRPEVGIRVPEIVAPSARGTSLACAHVVGAAAHLWATQPDAKAEDIRAALLSTARAPTKDQKHRVRYGALDAAAAAEALVSGYLSGADVSWPAQREVLGPWIDPRLRRRMQWTPEGHSIRAVLAGNRTEVLELTGPELAVRLEEPGLIAASATDVVVVELGSTA